MSNSCLKDNHMNGYHQKCYDLEIPMNILINTINLKTLHGVNHICKTIFRMYIIRNVLTSKL